MADYIVHKAVEPTALSAKVLKGLDKPTNWIVSPKYDGCHVIFIFHNGEYVTTLSRTGETVKSMAHAVPHLKHNYGRLLHHGLLAICGEAWAQGKEFNEISGLFRRHCPSPELQFVPFDIVPCEPNLGFSTIPILLGRIEEHPKTYARRLSDLWSEHIDGTVVLRPVHTALFGLTLNEALEVADSDAKCHKAAGGFDGAVLAQAGGLYKVGAGKGGEFIKCKPLLSYTVTVTGAALDFGTRTGKNTAALKFMLDGKEQKVSTGLSQQQVEEITAVGWDEYRIEVEAMGITVNGYLREPRFKGIRTDA